MLKQRREKILVILVMIVALLVSIKSFYLDAYEPEGESEVVAYSMLEEVIEDNHRHFFYQTGIFQTRVVSLKVEDQLVRARYRKYFLGAFPMGDRLSAFELPKEKQD